MTKLIRRLVRAGYRIEMSGGNHYRISGKGMRRPVYASGSPSDGWAIRKVTAEIRRVSRAQEVERG
jgi:hypothetical protein